MYLFSEPYLRRYEFEIVENNQKLYLVRWEGENSDAFLYKVPQDKMKIVQGIIKEAMQEYTSVYYEEFPEF